MYGLLFAFVGCRAEESAPADSTLPVDPPPCPTFAPAEAVGAVDTPDATEISGLVWWDGVLWAVDDSQSVLWAFDETGASLAAVPLDPSVRVVDAEDLARVGDELVIADVGDNLAARVRIELVGFTRPPTDGSADVWPPTTRAIGHWPDGARDCETILADPVSGDVLLVEKAFDGVSSVMRFPTPLAAESTGELVAELAFGEPPLDGATTTTGGAMSPAGDQVIVRTYLGAFAWPRVPGEPWADTFSRDACPIPLEVEPQGESIAWADDGLYTISEGELPTVWFYRRDDGR
ncbi:MAG: hypothetical protein ABMA64_23055 [Myxococcota bacterium]